MDRFDESGLIYRRSFDAAYLLDRFPPWLSDPNERASFASPVRRQFGLAHAVSWPAGT
jgi:hypothetical protein